MNEIITIEDTTFDVDQIQTMEDIKTFMLKLDAPDYKTKTIQTILLELGIYEDAKELYK